jgi:hypothetical protein
VPANTQATAASLTFTLVGDLQGSVIQDVAGTVHGDVLGTLHGDVQGKLLGGGGSTIGGVGAQVGAVASVTAGVTLAAGAITDAAFTVPAEGTHTGPVGWLRRVYRRFYNRVKRDATTVKVFRNDGTTVDGTQTYTASGSDEDIGAAV